MDKIRDLLDGTPIPPTLAIPPKTNNRATLTIKIHCSIQGEPQRARGQEPRAVRQGGDGTFRLEPGGGVRGDRGGQIESSHSRDEHERAQLALPLGLSHQRQAGEPREPEETVGQAVPRGSGWLGEGLEDRGRGHGAG